MKKLIAILLAVCATALHADPASDTSSAGWSGVIGAGPIVFPRYTGGKASQTWLIPMASITYDDIVYVEPLRAGAYVWGSEDKKMGLGLAIEPRFGFKSSDAPKLAGMATRRNSVEGGPAFDWDLGVVAVSASLFTDLTHASRGNSARLYVYRELAHNDTWKFGVFGGVDRMSSRVANYFFGVPETEATPGRAAFQARATTSPTLGFDGHYRVAKDYSLLFGLQVMRLGDQVANSPIVETRQSMVGWLGFGFNL